MDIDCRVSRLTWSYNGAHGGCWEGLGKISWSLHPISLLGSWGVCVFPEGDRKRHNVGHKVCVEERAEVKEQTGGDTGFALTCMRSCMCV